MGINENIINACRKLKNHGDSTTLESGAWTIEVHRLDLADIEKASKILLDDLIFRLSNGHSMGVSINVIWGNYISNEFDSESNVYFISYEFEGKWPPRI